MSINLVLKCAVCGAELDAFFDNAGIINVERCDSCKTIMEEQTYGPDALEAAHLRAMCGR